MLGEENANVHTGGINFQRGRQTRHTTQAISTPLKDLKKKLPLRVLSEEDWKHWTTFGYVIIPNAVPQDQVKRLVDVLWEFSEMDPNDPATWYRTEWRDHTRKQPHTNGMLEIYNHQYLWDNRQTPRIYDAFVDIWDREDLWVSIDRANLNPPNRGIHAIQWVSFTGMPILLLSPCLSGCKGCCHLQNRMRR